MSDVSGSHTYYLLHLVHEADLLFLALQKNFILSCSACNKLLFEQTNTVFCTSAVSCSILYPAALQDRSIREQKRRYRPQTADYTVVIKSENTRTENFRIYSRVAVHYIVRHIATPTYTISVTIMFKVITPEATPSSFSLRYSGPSCMTVPKPVGQVK